MSLHSPTAGRTWPGEATAAAACGSSDEPGSCRLSTVRLTLNPEATPASGVMSKRSTMRRASTSRRVGVTQRTAITLPLR